MYLKLLICILLVSTKVMANFDSTIPVVDMQDFYSSERRQVFIDDLANALKTVGFVAVINSDVDKDILDKAYLESKQYFAQPLDYKIKHIGMHGQRGYVQSESAKGQTVKDYKEFYHIAPEYSAQIRKRYDYLPNIWPQDPHFKDSMQKLMLALNKYQKSIEQALSLSIGEDENFFSAMTDEGTSLMRVIHYPDNPPANALWAAAHTDIDLFTILPRSTARGLQVLNAENKWVDVIVPDNAFIINAGDMLQNITNGVYKSSMHRVVCNDQKSERYSIVFFVHPRPTDQLGPLPKFIAQVGERKFADATQRELLSERLLDLGLVGPELKQELAKSGLIDRLIAVNRASPKVVAEIAKYNTQ